MKEIKLSIDGTTGRHVKNPKTTAQTLQRVLVKVVALAYAMLKTICSHSFEGVTNGFQCMNKFKKVNLKDLRERAATLQNSGQSLRQFYQFMPLQSDKWTPFAAIISQGHLPEVSVGIDAEGGHVAYVNSPGNSYEAMVSAYGLQRGDQLTFVTVQKFNDRYEPNYARLILKPRNADGSGAPMTTEIVNSAGKFPCSNWKNQLNFSTFEFDTDHFNFVLGRGGIVVAAGIIVSRKDKSGDWFRSNCTLVLNEAGLGSDLCSLYEAVEKSYTTAEIDMESEYYLNNAGAGDTVATSDVTPSGGSSGGSNSGGSNSGSGSTETVALTVTSQGNGTCSIDGGASQAFVSKRVAPGTTVNLVATPASGATFTQWSDGNTNASRSYVVSEATNLTATFSGGESGGGATGPSEG